MQIRLRYKEVRKLTLRKQFESFLENNLDSAYRFAYSYVGNREDAEDAVSESVVKALKALGGLKNVAYMKTWFFRIIINTANDMHRKNGKTVFIEDNAAFSNEDGVEDDYSRVNLESLFECLTEEQRAVVVLRFFEDMKLGQIAEVLSVNENTVKTRLYKALEIIKKKL